MQLMYNLLIAIMGFAPTSCNSDDDCIDGINRHCVDNIYKLIWSLTIRSPEPKVKILIDRNPIKTCFEQWAKLSHFSRTIAKRPDTTTWIWNLHTDAHDFDSHTSIIT
ncbi:unnamed protein product [Trifolium pratense]|uniref:Uncharacterized protein n=1 Tax=Trifolium pratense TaxID=57577 RepID=A0ACB0KFW0_TRIPR|nr:unnamed protein product [Trifolium pratense]